VRILVAVKSCNRDMANGCHQAIRDTWGKDFPPNVDVRFFVGEYDNANEARLLTDEIRLHVVDDLVHLPIKVREMANWSLEQGYDYTYLCDVDTFVIPKRLLTSGFENYDYFGRFMIDGVPQLIKNFQDGRLGMLHDVWNYASGGVGYFLSRKAAELISTMVPVHYAEDYSVGQVLGPLTMSGELKVAYPANCDRYVAWHYCTWGKTRYCWPNSVGFNPQWMRESYKKGQP
jgi:hypothetical protein